MKERSMESVKKKTREFVEKALLVHGARYTYDKVVYVNSKHKVCVTCPQHGDFFVRPDTHLQYGLIQKTRNGRLNNISVP